MLHFSHFDENERLRLDHPDLDMVQNLSPARDGELAKVVRLIRKGKPYILKRLPSRYEYDAMQWAANHGVPVPEIVDFIQLAASCYLLLEDIGSVTLESRPELVPVVVEWMIQLHQLSLPQRDLLGASNRTDARAADSCAGSLFYDTFASRKQEVLAVTDTEWNQIWDRWFTNPAEREGLLRAIEFTRNANLTIAIQPFSHGDLHPNNVGIRSDGRCCFLDWEFAGCQTIFTDLYALFDMCYPDAKACRYAYRVQDQLAYYASRMNIDSERFIREYQVYRLINHTREVICCYRDLCRQTRDDVSLTLQVEWIKHQIDQILEVTA